jgi:hypothetical protein
VLAAEEEENKTNQPAAPGVGWPRWFCRRPGEIEAVVSCRADGK